MCTSVGVERVQHKNRNINLYYLSRQRKVCNTKIEHHNNTRDEIQSINQHMTYKINTALGSTTRTNHKIIGLHNNKKSIKALKSTEHTIVELIN